MSTQPNHPVVSIINLVSDNGKIKSLPDFPAATRSNLDVFYLLAYTWYEAGKLAGGSVVEEKSLTGQ